MKATLGVFLARLMIPNQSTFRNGATRLLMILGTSERFLAGFSAFRRT